MNRKQQTEKVTEATKRSLERAGFALVGLGAYVVDAARSKQTPDALTDAGKAILNGFDRVEHRGRSAWPRATKAAEDATDRAKRSASEAGDRARERAKDTSERVRTSAEQARDRATSEVEQAKQRATETGVELRDRALEALTFLRNVAESKTGVHPNYADMTKEELYDRAQDLDIEGRSDMDKDELVRALRRHDNPDFEEMTKDELYELASEVDIEGRSKMSKAELVTALNDWLATQRDELVSA